MAAWLALHFPSDPKTAQPSKTPEAGIAQREYLAPGWVTRNFYGSNSTSSRGWQLGSGRLQLSPMNHRRSHGLQGNPRDEPGKETPPESPGLATCFPLDSSQGFGFTTGLFAPPEQFSGSRADLLREKSFPGISFQGSLGLDALQGRSRDPQHPLLHPDPQN